MPTYTYKCMVCKNQQYKTHLINENPEYVCCNQKLIKIISGCNFVLKGGGWGKDLTEKTERKKKSEKLGQVTKERMLSKDPDSYSSFKS